MITIVAILVANTAWTLVRHGLPPLFRFVIRRMNVRAGASKSSGPSVSTVKEQAAIMAVALVVAIYIGLWQWELEDATGWPLLVYQSILVALSILYLGIIVGLGLRHRKLNRQLEAKKIEKER